MAQRSKRSGDESYQLYLQRKKKIDDEGLVPPNNSKLKTPEHPSIFEVTATENGIEWRCPHCARMNRQAAPAPDACPFLLCDHCVAYLKVTAAEEDELEDEPAEHEDVDSGYRKDEAYSFLREDEVKGLGDLHDDLPTENVLVDVSVHDGTVTELSLKNEDPPWEWQEGPEGIYLFLFRIANMEDDTRVQFEKLLESDDVQMALTTALREEIENPAAISLLGWGLLGDNAAILEGGLRDIVREKVLGVLSGEMELPKDEVPEFVREAKTAARSLDESRISDIVDTYIKDIPTWAESNAKEYGEEGLPHYDMDGPEAFMDSVDIESLYLPLEVLVTKSILSGSLFDWEAFVQAVTVLGQHADESVEDEKREGHRQPVLRTVSRSAYADYIGSLSGEKSEPIVVAGNAVVRTKLGKTIVAEALYREVQDPVYRIAKRS